MRWFDKTFLGKYDFAPEELLHQIGRTFSYPDASESKTPWGICDWDHERDDAVVIGVEPVGGEAWIGMFARRIPSPRGASGVVALPDRETFAALCAGAVYRVSAHRPSAWEEISVGGVEAPVVVDDLQLVLFADHTGLVAYGHEGIAWKSAQLVYDDLHVLTVDGSTLVAEGFDAPHNRIVQFAVDLTTGRSDDAPFP